MLHGFKDSIAAMKGAILGDLFSTDDLDLVGSKFAKNGLMARKQQLTGRHDREQYRAHSAGN